MSEQSEQLEQKISDDDLDELKKKLSTLEGSLTSMSDEKEKANANAEIKKLNNQISEIEKSKAAAPSSSADTVASQEKTLSSGTGKDAGKGETSSSPEDEEEVKDNEKEDEVAAENPRQVLKDEYDGVKQSDKADFLIKLLTNILKDVEDNDIQGLIKAVNA